MRNFLIALAVVLLAPPALADKSVPPAIPTNTVFGYSSAAGDWVGQGQTRGYSPNNATFSITGNAAGVTILVKGAELGDTWTIDLAPPVGGVLQPGTYAYAEATYATGRAPGLNVYGNGRGCGRELWGEFGVRQISFDPSGNVSAIEASFTQRCGSAAPPMSGVIRYKMSPLSLVLQSDVGDPQGNGLHKRYYNDTTLFSVTTGVMGPMFFYITGQRDYWLLDIAPPTGQKFRKGKYVVSRGADATHAMLNLRGNGVGCNSVTGTLTVHQVDMDTDGRVNRISASFEQHCNGLPKAMRGVLRYGL